MSPAANRRMLQPSSFAFMVIFAFSTFETGHPAFALLATS